MLYSGHTQVKPVYFRETPAILEYVNRGKFGRKFLIDGSQNNSTKLYPG